MVTIKLNERNFEIKYDVNSIAALEEKYNLGVHMILREDNMGFSLTRNLLWAGILHKAPTITPTVVGLWYNNEIVNGNITFAETWEKLNLALTESGVLKSMSNSESDDEEEYDSSQGEIMPTT